MKLLVVFSGIIVAVLLSVTLVVLKGVPRAEAAPNRPQILGITHVALRVKNAAEARNFFGHILGFEALPGNQTATGKMTYTYFKVSDDQYILISPTLSSPTEDRLIHIAFRTADARAASMSPEP